MLNEYEEKRLEYNLALNELNKYKKDYETKRIELTAKKYNSSVKEKEEKIEALKKDMNDFFAAHQDEISIEMLKNNLSINDEFDFYHTDISKDDDGKFFLTKKTKEEIIAEIDLLRNKVQKRYDDKVITSIIYDDLNRCLDIYQKNILNKWTSLSKNKVVEEQEIKKIAKENKNVKKVKSDNWVFFRIMLPMIILDVICLLCMLFTGGECEIGSSEALSAAICSFTISARIISIFLTPIVLIYVVVKGIDILKEKKKK